MLNRFAIIMRLAPRCPTTLPPPVPKNAAPPAATPANTAARARESEPRGIQTIEVGGRLLLALAHHGQPLALKDLAQAAAMSPGKAHPYLVSFIKLGLVER